MAETINMPKLGFDMAEGLLVRWVKQIGEQINKGDVLAEIETDKATVEVESPASGTVLSHIVEQGSIVPVNAPIAIVGAEGEKVDAPAAAPSKAESPKSEEKPAPQSAPTPATTPQASSPVDGGPVKASQLARLGGQFIQNHQFHANVRVFRHELGGGGLIVEQVEIAEVLRRQGDADKGGLEAGSSHL